MNHLIRQVVRTSASTLARPQLVGGSRMAGARSLWHLTKQTPRSTVCMACNCGSCTCGRRFASSTGEKDLVEYLEKEIETETTYLNNESLPTTLKGFQVKYSDADVELVKKTGNETIEIAFNVNHTVDTTENGDADLGADFEQDSRGNTTEQTGDLQSKPSFEVNIIRGDTTLSLTCRFMDEPVAEGSYSSEFAIEEVLIYKGEHKESVYAASGEMLDGYFYDLLMNLLVEKEVDQEFAGQLCELATNYEQSLFVKLLKETKQFFQSK